MGPRKKNMLFLKKNRPKICRFKKSAYLCTRNRETNNEQNKNNKFTESKRGRLAQLVQSICLTSRGSAVRIRQRPPKKELHKKKCIRILRLIAAG